jgi:hypothetical protein
MKNIEKNNKDIMGDKKDIERHQERHQGTLGRKLATLKKVSLNHCLNEKNKFEEKTQKN